MSSWAAPAVALVAILTALVAFVRLPRRTALAVFLIAAAVALAVFRMFAIAGPLALLGFALLQQGRIQPASPSPKQTSEVRTDALVMWLDHDTGDMDGEVLAGPFAGMQLSKMKADDLQSLISWLEQERDEDSLSLILAYLDRHADPEQQSKTGADIEHGQMSEADAYRILGLEPGASVEQVRDAYKRLIKKVHPDLGGSSALTSMINAAKEKLDPS